MSSAKVFGFPAGCPYHHLIGKAGTVAYDYNVILMDVIQLADVKGSISTVPTDYGRENRCLHMGLSGSLCKLPEGTSLYHLSSAKVGPIIGPSSSYWGTPIPWGIPTSLEFVPYMYTGVNQRISKTTTFHGDIMTLVSFGSYLDGTTGYRRTWYYTMVFNRIGPSYTISGKAVRNKTVYDVSSYASLQSQITGSASAMAATRTGGNMASGSENVNVTYDWFHNQCAAKLATRHFLSVVPPETGSNLTYACVQQVQSASVNGIALVKDLVSMKGWLERISGIFTELSEKTLRSVSKASSAAALEYFYGLRLTTKDLKEVLDGIYAYANTNPFNRRRGSSAAFQSGDLNYEGHLGIYIPPLSLDFMKFRQLMSDFDFELTPSNLWDLIPFSFVIDWIVPVEEFLKRFELGAAMGSGRMRILYSIGSYKASTQPSTESGLVGGVLTVYRRDVFPMPPEMKLLPSSGVALPLDHTIEGMSLLVQGIL